MTVEASDYGSLQETLPANNVSFTQTNTAMKTSAVVVLAICILYAVCAADTVQAKRQLLTPGTCSKNCLHSWMKQLDTPVLCYQRNKSVW